MLNGQIYNIDFSGNKGSEINSIHLGIIFTIPKVNNMVFFFFFTSPKEKHFKTSDDFKLRNYLELRYQNLVYINQTDSIALLDQMRSISTKRLLSTYHDIVLDNKNIQLLTLKAIKYFKNILK